jgi:hypothetical protein
MPCDSCREEVEFAIDRVMVAVPLDTWSLAGDATEDGRVVEKDAITALNVWGGSWTARSFSSGSNWTR